MATGNQVAALRRMTDLAADDPVYTVDLLGEMIDAGSMNRAALQIWIEKAAKYVKMATNSEAGSSRSLGELHDNALDMIKLYQGLVAEEDVDAGTTGARRPMSVPIQRV